MELAWSPLPIPWGDGKWDSNRPGTLPSQPSASDVHFLLGMEFLAGLAPSGSVWPLEDGFLIYHEGVRVVPALLAIIPWPYAALFSEDFPCVGESI